MLTPDERLLRSIRNKERHRRTMQCIRWATEQLMEKYPSECLYKVRKEDGLRLRDNHPEEYKKLVRSRREFLNETEPLEEVQYKELRISPGVWEEVQGEIQELKQDVERLKQLVRELKQELRNKNDLQDWDDLEEI